jgi:hypothetical protein
MKSLLIIASTLFLLARCQQNEIPVDGAGLLSQQNPATGILNQEFELALHESLVLKSSTRQDENNRLGEITFSHLDESRCPANAMCIRQGAAITTFKITPEPGAEPQTVRLFVGDFMPNDPRNKRNLTADTVAVQLANKAKYRLILKKVSPYPGTSQDTASATLLLEMQ